MKYLLIIVLALCFCVATFAEDTAPISIPAYPGAEVGMEASMNNEDLMSVLPFLLAGAGAKLGNISEEDVSDLMKDVKQVEYLQMEYSKKDPQSKLISFYQKNIPSGTWNRVFYMKTKDGQLITVYSKANMEELYGYRFRTVKVDGKLVSKIDVARITGKLDFQKLISIATPMLSKPLAEKK